MPDPRCSDCQRSTAVGGCFRHADVTDIIGEPPRQFGPCIKCGGDDIRVAYHDGAPHCQECKRLKRPPPSCKYDECAKKGEHLKVWCLRCQYRWLEDVSDG